MLRVYQIGSRLPEYQHVKADYVGSVTPAGMSGYWQVTEEPHVPGKRTQQPANKQSKDVLQWGFWMMHRPVTSPATSVS